MMIRVLVFTTLLVVLGAVCVAGSASRKRNVQKDLTSNRPPIKRTTSLSSMQPAPRKTSGGKVVRRQRRGSMQNFVKSVPAPKPTSDPKYAEIRYNVDLDSMQSWASRWEESTEPKYCKHNYIEKVGNLNKDLQYVVSDPAGKQHMIQFALAEAKFSPQFNPNVYHSKAKYLKKYLASQAYLDALPNEFQGKKAPTLNIILHPANSVCVCQSWGPTEDRQFNIILSDLCFLGTAMSRNAQARGHPKFTVADGLAEWKQAQKNAAWSEVMTTANEMRAVGNMMHEVGHCLQQTYDPVGTNLARKNIAEYAASGKQPRTTYLAHAVSFYASGKNGVMDLVSETYAGLALGVTFPKHVMEVYRAFGGLLPKVANTDHQTYPLSTSISDSDGVTWASELMAVLKTGRPLVRAELLKAPKPTGFDQDDPKSSSEDKLGKAFGELFKGFNLVKTHCDAKGTKDQKDACYREGSNLRTRCNVENAGDSGKIETCIRTGVQKFA